MKRFFSILLALLILTACGAKGQAPASEPESSPSSTLEVIPAPEPSEPSPEEPEAEEPAPAEDPTPAAPAASGEAESDPEDSPLYFRLGPDGQVQPLRAGDTLGGWTLESYDIIWREGTEGVPDVDGANFIAPDGAPVELRGTIYLNPMAAEERSYWFDVAQEDYDKIPMLDGTDGRLWFRALDNAALGALETMGSSDRWDCRVAVSRYVYYHLPMAAINGAEIIRLELE